MPNADDLTAIVNEVLDSLQFTPNVQEAKVYLPPRQGWDKGKLREILVDWYHDPGDGQTRRWAWSSQYTDGEEIDLLQFRREAAFNAAAMFTPWAARLGLIKELHRVAPDGPWQDAVITLIAEPIIWATDRIEKGLEDEDEWKAQVSGLLTEGFKFATKLQDELAFRAAVLEVQRVASEAPRGD
jgi:hypothetical protein